MPGQEKRTGVIMDVSRLVSNMGQATPTGIDRTELRYSAWACSTAAVDVAFVRQIGNSFEVVPTSVVERITGLLDRKWSGARDISTALPVFAASAPTADPQIPPSLVQFIRRCGVVFYINASHYGIDRETLYLELHLRWRVRFIFYFHDLLPMQFPEYVKEKDALTHENCLLSACRLNSIILTNSKATAKALSDWGAVKGIPRLSAHVLTIGLESQFSHALQSSSSQLDAHPYFLMVGTIEPRKNHALVLNIWRDMCHGGDKSTVPRLEIVGKRGWESNQIFNFIERCAQIKGVVFEKTAIEDHVLRDLIHGARALLFPSFGEGWGMPIVEAIALGVPVICSDLPVFREAAQGSADYLDPLDAQAWRQALLEYAEPGSARRAAQIERQHAVQLPTWEQHFDQLEEILAQQSATRVNVSPAVPKAGRMALPVKQPYTPDLVAIAAVKGRKNFNTFVQQADIFRDSRDYHSAAMFYSEALKYDPGKPDIWIQFGHMLKEHGDFQAAFEAYSQAFVLTPRDVDLHIQVGHLLKVAGRKDDANRYYRLGFELDPSSDALSHIK